MLEIKGIHKKIGELEILKGVDLSVKKEDINVILGQSGSGKTTLLRCIDFLEKPDSGEIKIGQLEINCSHVSKKQMIEARRRMSFVFQNYGLFRNKTAIENVMLGLTTVRRMPKKEAREKAVEAIDKVGLLERLDYYPSQLSGGQQQRIAIARAIVSNPDVILMDEPTSALDPGLVGEVLGTIDNLAKEGVTMVIVTHEFNFARHIATNMMFMHEGKIIESAPTEEFFKAPKNPKTFEFLSKSSLDYSYVI